MKRYQVYLNPQTITVLEEVEKHTGLSRSSMIRSAVDTLADNLAKVLTDKQISLKEYAHLDSLIGVLTASEKTIHISPEDKSIYYKD
jgi:hypothetical protein